MIWSIIALVLGLAVGSCVTWLIVQKLPQDKIREINYKKLEEEKELFEEQRKKQNTILDLIRKSTDSENAALSKLRQQHDVAVAQLLADERQEAENRRKIANLNIQYEYLTNSIEALHQSKINLERDIEKEQHKAEETAKAFLKQSLELAQEQLDRALEAAAIKYQEDEEAYKLAYLDTVRECAEGLNSTLEEVHNKIIIATKELNELQTNIDSLVENAKREEELRQAADFYRLVLPEKDLEEIKMLRTVEPYLRDKEALNKVIWKVYYEKPYTDLIGRVIGPSVVTGIYKITNLENGMCYVGQAANVSDRWRQHIKRGIGAEAPTRNKLYPAMQEFGVENFSFELLEQCERSQLDAREDYFQEVFHAKDFGYSIK